MKSWADGETDITRSYELRVPGSIPGSPTIFVCQVPQRLLIDEDKKSSLDKQTLLTAIEKHRIFRGSLKMNLAVLNITSKGFPSRGVGFRYTGP